MINFYKTLNAIDKNLACDLNDMFKRVVSISTARQLKKLGALVYDSNLAVPEKPYLLYKEELRLLKLTQKDFENSKFDFDSKV
mmetsp:Transcript_39210/g.44931  ORF Transcript_39210/g.44931 Transcript_39210/m.44931 type:complete len:83 (+) Transcript_39210:770-1018(+)